MTNASLRSNVVQESARNRVANELMPRMDRLNDLYRPSPDPIPDPQPYTTFEQPTDEVSGLFGVGGTADSPAPASIGDAPPGSGVSSAVADASAISNAVNSPIGMAMAALAPFGVPIAMALNAEANNTLDTAMANMAAEEANVSLDSFGPPDSAAPADVSTDGVTSSVGPGAAADAAAAAADDGSASGDGGGGGGGAGKIVCTAMNQAYGFGSYRQAIWLSYSANKLTKTHERGYHRIFKPLVKYAFHSGNGMAKQIMRRFLEWIMRLRTADLRAEMRGKNPHPVRRVIRRACEAICYGVGKL